MKNNSYCIDLDLIFEIMTLGEKHSQTLIHINHEQLEQTHCISKKNAPKFWQLTVKNKKIGVKKNQKNIKNGLNAKYRFIKKGDECGVMGSVFRRNLGVL